MDSRHSEDDNEGMDQPQFRVGRCGDYICSGKGPPGWTRGLAGADTDGMDQMINTVGMGFVMVEVHYGLGRHKYFFTQVHYIGFSKYNYLDWCQVFITLAISKIAICLFLLRISKFERWRNFLYGMIAFLILTHLPITLAYIFQCRPVNKAWDIKVPGDCWPKSTIEAITIVQGSAYTILCSEKTLDLC